MRILDQLSPDVAAIEPYQPGLPIETVARELGLEAETIIKLASNESALGPSPKAVAAIAAHLPAVHRYPDGGAYLLREKLAAHYGLAPENVIPGNGSNEILELVGHCFLNAERSAVFSQHAFVVYPLVSTLFGAQMHEAPVGPGLGHDLQAIRAAVTEDTAVVFICNPNNPTGTIADPSELEEFVESMPDDVLVVIDEAYAEICPSELPDSVGFVREGRPVLVTRTFSKAYGMAGLRLGYGLGPAPLIRALQQSRQPFNVNVLAQVAGVAALDDVDFVSRVQQCCREAKEYLEAQCARLGLQFIASHANFMLIEVGDGAAATEQLRAQGVIVRPMGGYRLPNYIRVTFGLPAENERLVKALTQVLGINQ